MKTLDKFKNNQWISELPFIVKDLPNTFLTLGEALNKVSWPNTYRLVFTFDSA